MSESKEERSPESGTESDGTTQSEEEKVDEIVLNVIPPTAVLEDNRRTRIKSTGRQPSQEFLKETILKKSYSTDSSSDDEKNLVEEKTSAKFSMEKLIGEMKQQSHFHSVVTSRTVTDSSSNWQNITLKKTTTAVKQQNTNDPPPWMREVLQRKGLKSFTAKDFVNYPEREKYTVVELKISGSGNKLKNNEEKTIKMEEKAGKFEKANVQKYRIPKSSRRHTIDVKEIFGHYENKENRDNKQKQIGDEKPVEEKKSNEKEKEKCLDDNANREKNAENKSVDDTTDRKKSDKFLEKERSLKDDIKSEKIAENKTVDHTKEGKKLNEAVEKEKCLKDDRKNEKIAENIMQKKSDEFVEKDDTKSKKITEDKPVDDFLKDVDNNDATNGKISVEEPVILEAKHNDDGKSKCLEEVLEKMEKFIVNSKDLRTRINAELNAFKSSMDDKIEKQVSELEDLKRNLEKKLFKK